METDPSWLAVQPRATADPAPTDGVHAGQDPSTDAITRRLGDVHARLAGAVADILDLVNELQASEVGFHPYQTASAWLRWNFGFTVRTARRWARHAELVAQYPAFRHALAAGSISTDHLTVLHRHLRTDNADHWLERATALDAEDLREEIVESTDTPPPHPDPHPPAVWFRSWWTGDRLGFTGEIEGADGLLVETALMRLAADAPPDPASGLYRPAEERMAQALVQLASEHTARDTDPDRATLVVHVAAVDLVERSGPGWDAARRLVPTSELERILCDARIQPALHDADGVTVGVGRTTRAIAPWLRRLVERRDRGCRFPGCRRTRWIHCHHLQAWSADGPTNLDNLVSLCGHHHRLIHREGWTITGHPSRTLTFLNRFGAAHRPVRHPHRAPEGFMRRQIDESYHRRRQLMATGPSPPARPPP